jgi:hypothetical protein
LFVADVVTNDGGTALALTKAVVSLGFALTNDFGTPGVV